MEKLSSMKLVLGAKKVGDADVAEPTIKEWSNIVCLEKTAKTHGMDPEEGKEFGRFHAIYHADS